MQSSIATPVPDISLGLQVRCCIPDAVANDKANELPE